MTIAEGGTDWASGIRSLAAFDPRSGTSRPATIAAFTALLRADFASTSTVRLSTGEPWALLVGVEEAVGLLRCLEELSALYAGTDLAHVVDDETSSLRRRLIDASPGSPRPPAS